MADIFQGAPLPDITTTKQTQQVVPEFYTDYLQNIANLGQNAVTQGGVAGFSPLQQQAFQMAPQAAFSGAQTAGQGAGLLGAAGTTAAPDIVSNYMNPFQQNVVNEMSRLQQQNIQRNVLPALSAAGVGTGGFGSKRQATATGQTLADMQANLLGQQANVLNTGYQNAISAAQTDLSRQLQAGQGLGNIATNQYNIGTGGLKTLSDLGAIQQTQGQRELDYPMLQAQNYAKLFPISIPVGTTEQTVGAGQAGQYGLSPLAQIGSLLAGIGSFMNAGSGTAGTSGTATPAQASSIANSILSLPSSVFGQAKSYLNSLGINFKEGGKVNVPSHMHEHLLRIKSMKA